MEKIKIDEETGCWMWQAFRNPKGYGMIYYDGRVWLAHRLSFTLHRHNIPGGLCACHSCDTPSCVNPDHIFLGSNADNVQDAVNKGRIPFGESRSNSKLTDELVMEMVSKYANGATSRELSEEYGIHEAYVPAIIRGKQWKHVQRGGVKSRLRGSHPGEKHYASKLTDEQALAAKQLRLSGMAIRAIATRLGVSRQTVSRICSGTRWRHIGGPGYAELPKTPPRTGESHPLTPLTERDVREMRAARTNGETLKSLSHRFGVNISSISKICRHETWKHLE